MTDGFAAVVLAGGAARRMGGVDKTALRVGGRTLLDRTLSAVATADPLVVVGPRRATESEVRWAREDPPGSGPLAGLAAGLREIAEAELVAVLAADHPGLTAETISRLRAAVRNSGAVLVDSGGRAQWLQGVWRTEVLRAHMPEQTENRPMRALFGHLDPVLVPAVGDETTDLDTPEDLRGLR